LFSSNESITLPVNINSKISDIRKDLLYKILLDEKAKHYLKFPFDETAYVLCSKNFDENEKGKIFDNDKTYGDYDDEEMVHISFFHNILHIK